MLNFDLHMTGIVMLQRKVVSYISVEKKRQKYWNYIVSYAHFQVEYIVERAQ